MIHDADMVSTASAHSPAAETDPDVTLTRAVKALLAWHEIKPVDLEAAIGLPKSTAYRRFERGGWELGEVRALAYFFGVSVDQLTDGNVNLAESHIAGQPVRISRETLAADEARFSGSDIDEFLPAQIPRQATPAA